MKKFKLSLVAVAVMFAIVATAFTSNAINQSSSENSLSTTPLFWFDPSVSSFIRENERGDEFTPGSEVYITQCKYEEVECEKGYLQSQLVNPDQPQLGVKEEEKDNPVEIIYDLD